MGPALWGCALALSERAIPLSDSEVGIPTVPLRKGCTFQALGPPVPSDWGILCLPWDMLLGLRSRKGPFCLGPDDFSTAVASLSCALRVDLVETPVKSRQAHNASALTP